MGNFLSKEYLEKNGWNQFEFKEKIGPFGDLHTLSCKKYRFPKDLSNIVSCFYKIEFLWRENIENNSGKLEGQLKICDIVKVFGYDPIILPKIEWCVCNTVDDFEHLYNILGLTVRSEQQISNFKKSTITKYINDIKEWGYKDEVINELNKNI